MTQRVSQEPPRSVKRALMRRHSKAMRFALDADELDANLREAERLAEEDWQFALQAALPALEADLREQLEAEVRERLAGEFEKRADQMPLPSEGFSRGLRAAAEICRVSTTQKGNPS